MKKKATYISALLACAMLAGSAMASGTYNTRPPRPRVQEEGGRIAERDKYSLGKKIYHRKPESLVVQPEANRAAQEKKLAELQARLPASTRKKVNLPALAGKLSHEQLEALEYYVSKRYPSH